MRITSMSITATNPIMKGQTMMAMATMGIALPATLAARAVDRLFRLRPRRSRR